MGEILYSVKSVKEIQDLNPFIVVGCGGGGEKFSNLDGIEAIGYIDDDVKKQGKQFCGKTVAGSLEKCCVEKRKSPEIVRFQDFKWWRQQNSNL